MSASLYLNCFGTPELRVSAGKVVKVSTRKSVAVLALLCLAQERRVSREQIADMLWSGPSRETSTQSQRQALRHLRKMETATGIAFLDAGKTDIGLVEGGVVCDVSRISQLLTIAGADSFAEAAALWRGQFLNGYDALDPVFADWLTVVRQRLISDFMACALNRLESLSPKGDTEEIEAGCRFLLKLDSENEYAHRLLISADLTTDRKAEVEQQLDQCKVDLKAHPDAEPEEETRLPFEKAEEGGIHNPAMVDPLSAMARFGGMMAGNGQQIKLPELHIVSFTPSDQLEAKAHLVFEEILASLGASRSFDIYESSHAFADIDRDTALLECDELGSYILRFRFERENNSVYLQLENRATGRVQFNEIIDLNDFRNDSKIRRSVHQTVCRVRNNITSKLKKSGGQTPFAKWCQVEGLIWEFSPAADAKVLLILNELERKTSSYSIIPASKASIILKQILHYPSFSKSIGNSDDALINSQRAVALDPWQVFNHRMCGWSFLNKGCVHASKKSFQEAVRINPHDPMNLMSAAEAFAYMGDLDQSIRLADKARALFPVVPRIFYEYLGTIHFAAGDYLNAVQYLERGPVDSISSLATRVIAQLSAGNKRNAKCTLEILKNRIPSNNNINRNEWRSRINTWLEQINLYQNNNTRINFMRGIDFLMG